MPPADSPISVSADRPDPPQIPDVETLGISEYEEEINPAADRPAENSELREADELLMGTLGLVIRAAWERGRMGQSEGTSDSARHRLECALQSLISRLRATPFTREDVRHLRTFSMVLDGQRNGTLASIADRIEFLLSEVG